MLKDPTLGFNLYHEVYYIYSCYKQIDSNGILQTGDLELYTVSQIVFACVYTVKVCKFLFLNILIDFPLKVILRACCVSDLSY